MVKGAWVFAFLLFALFFTPRDLLAVGPHSATGSGQINGPNGVVRTFSFNAVANGSGVVSGHAELHDPVFFNESGHADVNCLAVSGNRAAIGGIVTKSDPPVFEGDTVAFLVVDNGEGPTAPPDQISFVVVTSGEDCSSFFALELHTIDAGNVQVR
jgi:hypothetical protein